ncbi:MAG: efflux transporter outer membrane subunit [Flavipsychrobacter sp.]|nr:efflux transporter outer membrane subunit [Flavipsychrobacter sp.]
MNNSLRIKSINLILFASLLSGCAMIPDYSRPAYEGSADWARVPGYEKPLGEKISSGLGWREFFSSPELAAVIETALNNNKDIKTATLNIEEARALFRIRRADLLPSIRATGEGNFSEESDESFLPGQSHKTEIYDAYVGITSYEIDLFGKIRSRNEAAINEYLSIKENYAVVRNALIGETANAYLQLLADQKLLLLTQKTLVTQKRAHDILVQNLEKGVGTEQDVARTATAMETAQVNLHQYARLVAQDKNALFLLMGVGQDTQSLSETTLDDIKLTENLSPGLPSDILLARPDIRQAEYGLLARNADIGAARAAFFPSVTLTGSLGFASSDLGNLFSNGATGAWSFLPRLTIPIFEDGRAEANLDVAEIRKEKAIINYEKAIQTAFREVSDELAAKATLDKQLQSQRRLVAAAQKVYNISKARYDSGIDNFLSVLDAQRELYSAQQNEIHIERQHLINLVYLYKVLGGGDVQ